MLSVQGLALFFFSPHEQGLLKSARLQRLYFGVLLNWGVSYSAYLFQLPRPPSLAASPREGGDRDGWILHR